MDRKKIVFVTGTRADFGKMKSILSMLRKYQQFEIHLFITGMHLLTKYGSTYEEVVAGNFGVCYKYINQNSADSMDSILAKTVSGFSDYIKETCPDMIVVHGDRVEALACAIVGSLNNVCVAHIEGGEVSGTVDELMRHSITKMAHKHFVANETAKRRLIQLGESEASIYIIGSPDIDIMLSKKLPSLASCKLRYGLTFDTYTIVIFHPVTTETNQFSTYAANFVDALLASVNNFVIIYPNNDPGCNEIFKAYERLKNKPRFVFLPSMRFEYFLILLKNAECIVGNSSVGIREAPVYGVPTVNVGTRQRNRSSWGSIINVNYEYLEVKNAIAIASKVKFPLRDTTFGCGDSDKKFISLILNKDFWASTAQKQFIDLESYF